MVLQRRSQQQVHQAREMTAKSVSAPCSGAVQAAGGVPEGLGRLLQGHQKGPAAGGCC